MLEHNTRKPEDVRAAVIDQSGIIYGLWLSGELNKQSEVFEDWLEDHWIGIVMGTEDIEKGRGVEAKEEAEELFGNPFSNRGMIAYATGRYLYLISPDEVRAELESFVPQDVRDLLS